MCDITTHVHYTCFSEGNHTFSSKESGLHDKGKTITQSLTIGPIVNVCAVWMENKHTKAKTITKSGVGVAKHHARGIHSLPTPLLGGCLLAHWVLSNEIWHHRRTYPWHSYRNKVSQLELILTDKNIFYAHTHN